MSYNTIEIVSFRLIEGADLKEFMKNANATVEFLAGCEGFVRRQLSRDQDGLWTDYVEWSSPEKAKQAAENLMKHESVGPFMSSIDSSTVMMRHCDLLMSQG